MAPFRRTTVAKFLDVAPGYLLELAAKRIMPRAIDPHTGKEIQRRWRLVEASHRYIHYLRDQAFGKGASESDWRKEQRGQIRDWLRAGIDKLPNVTWISFKWLPSDAAKR